MRCNASSIASSAAAAASPIEQVPALYVHVPYCTIRCPYCDFATLPHRPEAESAYLDELAREFALIAPHRGCLTSLFIGGGTPNALGPASLERLRAMIHQHFDLQPGAELSIEANPALVSRAQATELARLGVTRVSLGAQSFTPATLRFLGRDHDAADVARAVDRLRSAGIDDVNLDLIFGVPGQSLDDWRHDLAQATALAPTHVSVYELTFERGTPLYQQWLWDRVVRATDDHGAALYALARETLAAHGYQQYEISNFARPSRRSRHNVRYWENGAYFGVGVSAASYVAGERRTNHRSIRRWEADLRAGTLPTAMSEHLDPLAAARETVVLGLRMVEGIPERRLRERYGCSFHDLYPEKLPSLIDRGLLIAQDGRLRLADHALPVADSVLVDLV